MAGLTETLPVAGLNVSPLGTVKPDATVIVTDPVVAAALFRVSRPSTFSTLAAPLAPLIPLALSSAATMGAAMTVTVSVAMAQLAGFKVSQMR